MDLVVRAAIVYLVLLTLMRISGNRQFSELTAFDAVLLIIISEATQQALMGDQDFSLTAAFIVIVTLLGIDILMSLVKQRWDKAETVIEGVPVLLVDDGKLIRQNLDQERVDEEDIMAAARQLRGLESIDEIKYAVLERDGVISIIPRWYQLPARSQ
jgi:uncharacterized membrane protein YcaP (DUF421 family)